MADSASPDPPEEPPSSAPNSSALDPRFDPDSPHFVRTASYTFLIINTLVNLVADLASKWWAKSTFEGARTPEARKVVVIENAMNFIFAKNKGGAWGLLQNETEALRRPFFLIVSVAAIVFIVSLYRKLTPTQKALKWGLPLVLGGALGNLVDRIRYGYVVDFIDVYVIAESGPKHWPTFNVADISICVGVFLMAIDMFTHDRGVARGAKKDDEKAEEAAPEPVPLSEQPPLEEPPPLSKPVSEPPAPPTPDPSSIPDPPSLEPPPEAIDAPEGA